ncbi:hypothetical protein SORBI_3006G216150 [Sorghum bicolor]|uniref:Uncharacterized protein n=1 Tax=Sorghum bicolor TaxID=4558 RepID=A0A1Z5RF13_SORBI|nr:hypothetical protein SORBI_3006G216150 [Sorghum bicolor]
MKPSRRPSAWKTRRPLCAQRTPSAASSLWRRPPSSNSPSTPRSASAPLPTPLTRSARRQTLWSSRPRPSGLASAPSIRTTTPPPTAPPLKPRPSPASIVRRLQSRISRT